MLRDLTVREHQAFVTAVGQSVGRRRTVQNVYGTLTSILNRGRKWGYFIPEVRKPDVEFPADQTPKSEAFFFDADAASLINVSPYPFKLMFLIAATCGLRIGEVTALKRSSLDFKRELIHITAAFDYATRKETTPKSSNSAAPLHMTALLEQHPSQLGREALSAKPKRLSLPELEGPAISLGHCGQVRHTPCDRKARYPNQERRPC